MKANAFGGVNGLIYQPRGSLFEFQGGDAGGAGGITSAAKVITGAMSIGGGQTITLIPNAVSANQTTVSLIR